MLHGCGKVTHAFVVASQAEVCGLQIDAIVHISYPEGFIPLTTRLQYHHSAAVLH